MDDTKEMAKSAIDRTAMIIDKFGPRIAGSEPCLKAADAIYECFKQVCDKCIVDPIKIRPEAFLRFGRWMAVLYYIAVFVNLFDFWTLAVIFEIIAIAILFLEYIFYFQFYDVFYPLRDGKNVAGIIEPKEDVRSTILFSGHHDSAYIFNFYVDHPEIYLHREITFLIVIFTYFIFLLCHNFYGATVRIIVCLFYGTVGVYHVHKIWYFCNEKGTPGAGDNLVSSCMGIDLAKYYKEQGGLKHTRLIFASYDAEEAGLRGSHLFFKQHKEDFKEVPTWNFNIDCPYYHDEIKFLLSDINSTQPLDKHMAEECNKIAQELGIQCRTAYLPVLAGGTDAAEAARAGLKATTCLGIPFNNKYRDVVYHTPGDTPDNVEPECIENILKIFMKFAEKVDNGDIK